MKKHYLIGILILAAHIGFTQLNINECLKLINFELKNYSQVDVNPTDTVSDIKNGYYAIFSGEDEWRQTLCEATVFNNLDGTQLLVLTGFSSDEQCGWYNSFAYLIAKDGQTITELQLATLLPDLNVRSFLQNSKAIEILEKYLPEIKKEYLGNEATIDDVLNEIYSIRYALPRKGTTIKSILNICDYIPTNATSISPEDWAIVERDFLAINLFYDKKIKRFKVVK